MRVTEYRLLNRSDRRQVVERLDAVFRRWREEWWPEGDKVTVDIDVWADPAASATNAWRWFGATVGDARVCVGLTEEATSALSLALVGQRLSEKGTPVVSDTMRGLARTALEALAAVLMGEGRNNVDLRSIRWDHEPPNLDRAERTRGLVARRCRLDSVELVVVLNPTISQQFLARAPRSRQALSEVVPIRAALALQSVDIRVCAGCAELTIPELRMLSSGDVIRLDSKVETPLVVKISEDTTMCGAYLGTAQGFRAIQLTDLKKIDEVFL